MCVCVCIIASSTQRVGGGWGWGRVFRAKRQREIVYSRLYIFAFVAGGGGGGSGADHPRSSPTYFSLSLFHLYYMYAPRSSHQDNFFPRRRGNLFLPFIFRNPSRSADAAAKKKARD